MTGRHKRADAARAVFAEVLAEAQSYVDGHQEESAALHGAAEYLRGLAPLRQLAAKDALDSADRAEVLTWYNKTVELFNRIVIAR